MQVTADNIHQADAVLNELLTVTDVTLDLADAATPLREAMKKFTTRKSPPVYMAETGRKMKEKFISDFSVEYPTISSGITNGRLGPASYRMHDGLYKLGTALRKMSECKFMVLSDDDRVVMHDALLDAAADFAIYTIIAFSLHLAPSEHCTLAVSSLCERRKVTPSVLYGELLDVIKNTGRSYYAYEPLSPLYSDMLATEPAFLAECEDQGFPLTEEMAREILDGTVPAAQVLETLMKQNADMESTEVDVNPFSLISRMSLE